MARSNVKSYTDKELLDRAKNTKGFEKIPEGIWIMGIRSDEDEENVYDDKFYIFEDETFLEVISGTTHPGADILKGGFLRFNKVGAAVLKSDMWYNDMWSHIYRASRGDELRQVNKVTVYRDGDKDGKSEEIGTPIHGLFGINFHTNTFKWYNELVKMFIGAWSAGCQVTNRRDRFLHYMKIFKARKASGEQKYVSYCLLKEF